MLVRGVACPVADAVRAACVGAGYRGDALEHAEGGFVGGQWGCGAGGGWGGGEVADCAAVGVDGPGCNAEEGGACDEEVGLEEALDLVGWDEDEDGEVKQDEKYEADETLCGDSCAGGEGVLHVEEAWEDGVENYDESLPYVFIYQFLLWFEF